MVFICNVKIATSFVNSVVMFFLRSVFISYLPLLLIGFSYGCNSAMQKTPQADIQVKVPAFNADSAYALVKKQVAFGPRYTNSPGHDQIRDWLLTKIEAYADVVIRQDFTSQVYTGEMLNGTNIIARYKPEVLERILLCAHYDTRHIAEKDTVDQDQPILGADDGASGVAVVLEIARQLKENPIPMGVDIIFFDAEDYGEEGSGNRESWGLGSQYWSNNIHEADYQVKYGILLDMVGSRQARFTKEGNSRASAGQIVDKIWQLAENMNKQQYFVDENTGSIVDDHYFIILNTGIPMVDIINHPKGRTFGAYHHTHRDNLDIIDRGSLQAVGQVVLAAIYNESNKKF